MKASAILISLFLLPLAAAHAGVISGGGGGAFVCRDKATGAVLDSELVDLFEARANNVKVKYDNVTPIKKQVEDAIAKLRIIAPEFGEEVLKAWPEVYAHRAGSDDTEIDVPTDVDKHYSKKGCKLEGMMYFDDRHQNLVMNHEIFDKQKTKTDFAASYLHESIYKVMRDKELPGGRDSVLTRIIVGCLVANQDAGECLRLQKTAVPSGSAVWNCRAVGNEGVAVSFYLSESLKGDSFLVTLVQVGKTPIEYKTVLAFDRHIQTLPDFSPDSHGTLYELKDSKIVGLQDLGNPVGELLSTIEIPQKMTRGAPIQIHVNDSDQNYICKGK